MEDRLRQATWIGLGSGLLSCAFGVGKTASQWAETIPPTRIESCALTGRYHEAHVDQSRIVAIDQPAFDSLPDAFVSRVSVRGSIGSTGWAPWLMLGHQPCERDALLRR